MKILREIFKRWLPPLIWFYFTLLFGWLFVYLALRDQQGYLALINIFAKYLFIPAPLMALLNLRLRRREIWGMSLLALVVFLFFWGQLFIPSFNNFPDELQRLRVMTYNTLGYSDDPQAAINVMQRMAPDVIFIQELNTALAEAVQEQMLETYPYQLLDAQDDPSGMGLLSKYPFIQIENDLPEHWVGQPQFVRMDWEGQEVDLLNFHMWATGFSLASHIEENFRQREAQAQAIDELAASNPNPLIVAGDANATSLNTTHHILTQHLCDVWLEAGFGFGHTFPGGEVDFSLLPNMGEWIAPQWIIRIDYILVSAGWGVDKAYLAPFDGTSDHRAVVAELVLLRER